MKTKVGNEIDVRVMFFGAAKDAAGAEEICVRLDQPAVVKRLREVVDARCPQIALFGRSLFVAVNQEYAHEDDPVRTGDEVAFFPPVSGG